MAEQTKKRSMTTDMNTKKKNQIQHSGEGKQSGKGKQLRLRTLFAFMGSVVPQLPLIAIRWRQRT